MNKQLVGISLGLFVQTVSWACPDISGHYLLQGEDGISYLTVRQTKCKQVEIETESNYLGKPSNRKTLFILDGKDHAIPGEDGTRTSRFVKNQLEIKYKFKRTVSVEYYFVGSDGHLHMNGLLGETEETLRPHCGVKSIEECEQVAIRQPR